MNDEIKEPQRRSPDWLSRLNRRWAARVERSAKLIPY
jgi:hypothetical protein